MNGTSVILESLSCLKTLDSILQIAIQFKYLAKNISVRSCFEATFIFAQKETNKTMFQMEIFSASINYVNK